MEKSIATMNNEQFFNLTKSGVMSSQKVTSYIVNHVVNNLRNGVISIPTLQKVIQNTGIEDDLLEIYDMYTGSQRKAAQVEKSVRVVQAALFDSPMFVLYEKKGKYGIESKEELFTMNYLVLSQLGVESKTLVDRVIKKNIEGECKAFRIDPSYEWASDALTYTAVEARTPLRLCEKDSDPNKSMFVVPLVVVNILMTAISRVFESQQVARVSMIDNYGETKVRYLTQNASEIQKYRGMGVPNYMKSCRYFPLTATIYAPVLGASPSTLGLERIGIFSLTSFKKASDAAIKEEVKPVLNPLRVALFSDMILSKVKTMLNSGDESKDLSLSLLAEMVSKMAGEGNMVAKECLSLLEKNQGWDVVHGLKIAMRRVSTETEGLMHIVDFASALKLKGRLAAVEGLIKKYDSKPVDLDVSRIGSAKYLRNFLSSGVLSVVYQNSDGSMRNILCTNCSEVLMAVYGENYSKTHESFNFRASEVYKALLDCEGLSEDKVKGILRTWNFKYSRDVYGPIFEAMNSGESAELFVKKVLAEAEGVNLKASESASKSVKESKGDDESLFVRALSAYEDNGTVKGYYHKLDLKKVVSVQVLLQK